MFGKKDKRGLYKITMSETQFKKMQALFWTVQNTFENNEDVQEELASNLQYFNLMPFKHDFEGKTSEFDFYFRNIIDTAAEIH